MKTIDDLKKILPRIIEKMLEKPEIGYSACGSSEDDTIEEWAENNVFFEEDGWEIDIQYRCVSDSTRTRGEVTEIYVSHYDDATDEETTFDDESINEITNIINRSLYTIK